MGIASIIGAIGGSILGFLFGVGPIGGLLGYGIGKILEGDDSRTAEDLFSSSSNKEQVSFQMSLLTLMAAVMQANGQTKRCELDYVKDYIRKAFTTEEDQKNALQLLKNILEQPIDVDGVARQVAHQMNIYHRRELLHFLLGIGYADGDLDYKEDATIKRVARNMGIDTLEYEAIKATYATRSYTNSSSSYGSGSSSYGSGSSSYGSGSSGYSSSGYGNSGRSSSGYGSGSQSSGRSSSGSGSYNRGSSSSSSSGSMSLSRAYTILGITAGATDDEVKKAYRSMAKKNHPDRVATLGEAVVKEAEKKFRSINEAYEYIKNYRGMS